MPKIIKKEVLLVFNTAYTFEQIKKRHLEVFIRARNPNHYFSHVITVNPLASLQYEKSATETFGSARKFIMDSENTIIEGRVARIRLLSKFPKINFFLAQISLLYKVFLEIRTYKVILVRGEDPRVSGFYAVLFSKLLKVPLMVGVWGNPGRLRKMNGRPNQPGLFRSCEQESRFEKWVLKRASFVASQNEENLSFALEQGVEISRTGFVRLGVGIDSIHYDLPRDDSYVKAIRNELGITTSQIVIVVARLEKEKMVDHAIRAFSILIENDIDAVLVIIGEGREVAALQELSRELSISNRVFFVGAKDQRWIARCARSAVINLAPLCGRSLLEVSLGGCPSVAYDLDWHNELVIDGKTGYLATPGNWREFGEKTLILLKQDALRSHFSSAVLKLAHQMGNRDANFENLIQIYNNLTTSTSRRII